MAFDDLLSIFGGPMGGNLFGQPGASQLFNDMPVPGVPAMGGQPEGLLARAPEIGAQPLANGPQVADYSIPGSGQQLPPGTTTAATPPPIARLFPPTPPPPKTAAVDPDRNNPLLAGRPPNAGGGPDERTAAPPPIVPPKIDLTKPTSSGTTVPGQAAPPPPGTVPPAAVPPAAAGPGAAGPGGPGMLDKLNKAVAGMSAPGKPPPLHPASIGSAGQPHIPQGGAQLMQQLLEMQAKGLPVPGKVPSMGGTLGRRVQGLI